MEGEGNAFRDPGPWGSRKGSALSCWVTPTISMGISSTPMSGYTAPPTLSLHPSYPQLERSKSSPSRVYSSLAISLCCAQLRFCFWFSLFQWKGPICALEELFPALEKCLAQSYSHIAVQPDLSQDGLEPAQTRSCPRPCRHWELGMPGACCPGACRGWERSVSF